MKFLKGLALTILSFLLFLSLSVFGLALTLNYTLLNPDFVTDELDKLDISSLVKPLIEEQIRGQLPPETQFMSATIDDIIDDTLADLEPLIKEQADIVIHSGYDYLMGRSQNLNVVISLEPMKESLRDNLREAFYQSLPPELKGLPQAEKDRYFNEFYQGFAREIPSTFEFNESSLPPDVLARLEQVRQFLGYFQLGFKALIGFMLLLILGIILINRGVRNTTRGLGITFLTYGALEYAGIFAAKYLAGTQMGQLDIPTQLQTWLPQFIDDFLAPLEMFSLGLMIGGAVLIIVSIAYKPRQTTF